MANKKNNKQIDQKRLAALEASFAKKPVQQAMQTVLYRASIFDATLKMAEEVNSGYNFNVEIKTLPPANQKQSGRCWIFAAMNFLREEVGKKCKLESFELSQNYIAFYDKLEKINFFVEAMDDFLTVDNDDRTLQYLLQTGIQDGGQWQMVANLIEKYGVVPKAAMPETVASSATYSVNSLINIKLRQYAKSARALAQAGKAGEIAGLKAEMLDQCYTLLAQAFGNPPKTFTFEYTDKDGKYGAEANLTPQTFYQKYVGLNLHDYVSLINAPTADKPYYKTFTVDYLGNVVEGAPIHHLNVPMAELKAAIVKQLQAGQVVWFGCDTGFGNRKSGVWSEKQYAVADLLGLDLSVSKAEQLDYRISTMGHAMILTGVLLAEDGTPLKWKIQNSWGEEAGHKGYYLAEGDWFDKYTYQAVVRREYLPAKAQKALEQAPLHLKPWDPMGSLA